jgi:hypothetical protein
MVLNFITSAKGGVGKTFLTFLYFLDAYQKTLKTNSKKYIFIDLNYINRDLYNIFQGITENFPGRKISQISNFGKFPVSPLVEDKIFLLWNNDDFYFPKGMADLLDFLASIFEDPEVKKYIDNSNLEIFIDSNLHLKNFFSLDKEELKKITLSLEKIKSYDIKFRVLFIWSFALLLEQRNYERQNIKEGILPFAEVWKDEKYDWQSSLFEKREKKTAMESQSLIPELAWSIDNLYHIFNYYIPFNDSLFNHTRKNTLKTLYNFSNNYKKAAGKGVSFHYINDEITAAYKKIKANPKKQNEENDDLDDHKMLILRSLARAMSKKDEKNRVRPDNVIVIPTFDAKFAGFTERIAEMGKNLTKYNRPFDIILQENKEETPENVYQALWVEFQSIITEINLREVNE